MIIEFSEYIQELVFQEVGVKMNLFDNCLYIVVVWYDQEKIYCDSQIGVFVVVYGDGLEFEM